MQKGDYNGLARRGKQAPVSGVTVEKARLDDEPLVADGKQISARWPEIVTLAGQAMVGTTMPSASATTGRNKNRKFVGRLPETFHLALKRKPNFLRSRNGFVPSLQQFFLRRSFFLEEAVFGGLDDAKQVGGFQQSRRGHVACAGGVKRGNV